MFVTLSGQALSALLGIIFYICFEHWVHLYLEFAIKRDCTKNSECEFEAEFAAAQFKSDMYAQSNLYRQIKFYIVVKRGGIYY